MKKHSGKKAQILEGRQHAENNADISCENIAAVAHSAPEGYLFNCLKSSKEGLTSPQAAESLSNFGPNELRLHQVSGPLQILIRQFKNILIVLLLLSAGVAFMVNDLLDAIGILVAVALSVFFGFFQEYKAEQALSALRKIASPHANVIRDGRETEVLSSAIVPGDLLVLSEGDLVPADCRMLEGANVSSDQSALTGESVPSSKSPGTLGASTPLAERKNMLYAGTTIVRGHCRAIAFSTGVSSEFGKIAEKLASMEDEPAPLTQKISALGENIGKIAMALCFFFFLFGVWRGEEMAKMLIIAISLAVAAIPEGLPTVLAITLAIGVQRMAQQHAIVRKLPAVETLGSATVICTDKTGTLTANRMTLMRLFTRGTVYSIGGGPLDLRAGIFENDPASGGGQTPADSKALSDVRFALSCGALCNDAAIFYKSPEHISGTRGDPTEIAILVAAEKAGMGQEKLREQSRKISEIAFEYTRKMMTQVRMHGASPRAYSKGAPEKILSLCTKIIDGKGVRKITDSDRKEIHAMVEKFGRQALRTLAFAYSDLPSSYKAGDDDGIEKGMVFVGMAGFIDPPRKEVAEAIALSQSAGIRIVMITGDSHITASVIAEQLGLLSSGGKVRLGDEIGKMSEAELSLAVKDLAVCARATPEHKYMIVAALKRNGEIVAVTGDGVNDAPSIKAADIGIAMGVGGTDVARGAADVILTDNNFRTITMSIRQGRSIYENIRSFVRFQFTTNVAALTLMFSCPLLGFPLPLAPLQILWANIMMDGPPALALGIEPSRSDAMSRPPRKPSAPFVSRTLLASILTSGFLMFAITLAVFAYYDPIGNFKMASTMAFTTFIMLQLANAFNCRSDHLSAFNNLFSNKALIAAVLVAFLIHLGIIYLPDLQAIFGTVPLTRHDWALVAGGAIAMVAFEEMRKRFFEKLTEY